MTNILTLVDDLYLIIFLYLIPRDQIQFSSMNKPFVKILLKKHRQVIINQKFIQDFIINTSFQERLSRSIENPSKQLFIDLQGHAELINDPPIPIKKHPFFPNIFKLVVSWNNFQNYYSHLFETIENLFVYERLYKSDKIFNALNCFENYQSTEIQLMYLQVQIIGFFPMTLKELKVYQCTHTTFDVSTLWWKTLNEIELIHCENLITLPDCFNFIPIIKIHSCNGLQDLRMLQDNEIVKLSLNYSIFDFNDCFKNSRVLDIHPPPFGINFNLYDLEKIEDLSWSGSSNYPKILPGRPLPPSLRKLKLINCEHFTDLSPLQELEELSLNEVEGLVSVEGLGRIPVLELRDLRQLESLEGLGKGNKDVYIDYCDVITSFLPLQSVEKVSISDSRLLNGNDVKYVTHLILERCPIEDVSPLSNIRILELVSCEKVKNYQTLKNNKSIRINLVRRPFPWTDDLKELLSQYPIYRVNGADLYIKR